jgi:peptidyl-prolyl cis-trans isomerase C
MKNLVPRLAALSLAAVSISCTQGTSTPSSSALGLGSVATVNGKSIPESVFRVHTLNATKKNADDLTAEEHRAVLDDLIGIVVMAEEAEKQGLLAERTIAAQMELSRLQLAARAMATRFLEKNPASELEIKALYDENLPRLAGQQFKARHILVDTEEEAAAVIKQLDEGRDFLDLANERASGKTGPNGGDLGWFTADSMVQPVAQAITAMKVGAYSTEPVKTDYGYHVLLLEDTRSQEPPSMSDVREELVNAVQRDKLQKHMQELVAGATVAEEPK